MASGALIGAVCGTASGLLFGILCCLIYFYLKKRNDKTIKPGLNIKPTIPQFTVPRLPLVPIPIQQPVTQEQQLLLPVPQSPSEGSRSQNGSRRSSVQLQEILTSISTRDSPPDRITSPTCIKATNESAIASIGLKKVVKKGQLKKSRALSLIGKLEFSLFYDPNAQELQIYIVRCLQVYIPGTDGPSNLVVKAIVLSDGEEVWQDQTKPVEACSEPDFSQQLIVHGLPTKKMRKGSLRLLVLEDNTGHAAGEVIYPLSNLPFNLLTNETLKLTEVEEVDFFGQNEQDTDSSNDMGKLHILMYHNRNEKKLSIVVECAEDLPDMNKGTAVDSYVKVSVMHCGKRLYSRSTKVVNKTRNPHYGEEFDFVIPDDKLPQVTVYFKVKHHGKMRDTSIGMVKLGYKADHETEHRHLEQVLDKPHLYIGNWHDIRKYR